MVDSIKKIVSGKEAVIARISRAHSVFQGEMSREVKRQLILLRNYVVRDKLSGQALHVRSGRLRSSINWKITEESGSAVSGSVGTGVEYAAAHEYGFKGLVNVSGHLRNVSSSTKATHAVRAHTRMVNMPERSFLRSSLRARRDLIVSSLREAAVRAVRRVNGKG